MNNEFFKKISLNYVLILIILLMLGFLLLLNSGIIGIWRDGIAFLQNDSDYITSYNKLGDTSKMEVDLNNLDSNIGKTIFDDGECSIQIEDIKLTDQEEYQVFFRTRGIYNKDEGRLISLIKHFVTEGKIQTYEFGEGSGIKTIVDNKTYIGSKRALTSISYKDGDEFAFSLFPLECYENGNFLLQDTVKNTKVEIQLTGLLEHTWYRLK